MQKIRRGIYRLLFLSVFLMFALAGCGKQNQGLDPKNPVKITVWHYYNGAQKQMFADLVSEFNQTEGKKQGILVEEYSQGSIDDLNIKVIESIEMNEADKPDIFAAYADTAYNIFQEGKLVDLDQYLSKEEEKEYVDAYLSEGKFKDMDSIYVFPTAKSTEIFTINKTDWNKFAKATNASEEEFSTWEGIVRIAEQYYKWTDSLTSEPNDGKAFFGRDSLANYIIIGSNELGHEIFQVTDGKVEFDFNKEAMKRLWDNYYIPYIHGYFASSGRFRSDDVKTGDIIACVEATSGISYFPEKVSEEDGSSYPIEAAVYPLPSFEGVEPFAVQQGAGMCVLSSDKQKEYASVEFLKWFTEEENNIKFSIGSGYLPVKKSANTQEAVDNYLSESKEVRSLLADGISIGVKTVRDYSLYTAKPFKNGYTARGILNTTLDEKAKKDRKKVVALMKQGMSAEDATAKYTTDQNFEQWYQSTREQLLKLKE